jgi:hypothetical protein
MITCNLQGGLGNQLFQIAATYSLAKRNNDDSCFDLNRCNTPNQGRPSINYSNTVLKNVCNRNYSIFENYHIERNFSYEEIQYKKNLCLNGYFQSEKYFANFSEEIKKLFYVEFVNQKKTKRPITSVHIRRGDYIKFSEHHNLLDIEYYKKAMSHFYDSDFLFFSDDMEWVKKNFIGNNIFYSELNDDILDFYSMSSCDNNIIANSSFSWWAAYLNKNINKIIVSPNSNIWFGPKGPKDTQDLIPNNWIQI